LLAFLGVAPGEERGVALMAAHSFAMGCSTVFFETAASATFLTRFSASYLPWIYIAAAAFNTVTGTVYARVQQRVSFARLMKGTLWFLLAIVASVRTGFALTNVAWIAFAGLVSYRILSSLTDLEYWAVASRIYDVRQAKRLFGLIGTGEVIARIVGAFSVPLLVELGGVDNLMLLSAIGLAVCLILLGLVLKPVDGTTEPPKAVAKDARAGIGEILGSKYLAMVIGVAILATFGKYFVDFAFLEEMSTVTKGEAQLATFLGIFNGLAQTLSLLTRLFVSRPFLHRFGIRVGVVVLPTLHALCAAATVAAGAFGADAHVVFWLVIANQGLYKTFKHPIDNASFKVLYQPLKAAQRLAAQIAVEIIFSPVVVGLAGGVMLLFTAGMTYDPTVFSIVLLANFIGWAVLARAAGRGYGVKLLDNLKQKIEGNVALHFDDATSLNVLRTRLASDSPAEVCVALSMLERAAAPELIETLVSQVGHASADVRAYALERLVELKPSALRGMRALRGKIASDPMASVRRLGARAAAATGGADALAEVAPYLRDADPVVRRAAVTSLFELADDAAVAAGVAAIEGFAASEVVEDRALAARLAGEHALPAVVRKLLGDANFAVRRAAIAGAGRLGGGVLTDELVADLIDPRLAHAAVTALATRGEAALAVADARFLPDADRALLRRLVDVYRAVGTPAAAAALRSHLPRADAELRGRILAALDALRYTAREGERAAITALVEDEAREATWTLGVLRDLGDAHPDLRAALHGELAAAGQRVFALLGCIHDRTAVHRIAANITHAAKDKRAYANEVLDLTLEPRERELVTPLVDDGAHADKLRRLAARFPQPARDADAAVHAIADRDARWLRSFPRALARRALHPDASPKDPAMLLIEKVLMLKTVPMFARTSDEILAEMAALFEEVDYRAGETIVTKGEVGESMFLIVRGRVRVFDGDTTLSELADKEIFGELALLDPQPRSASVQAIDDARLFRLDGETFSQLMAGNLEIVRGVLAVLCERLRRTSATAGGV
jgi:CRP-like cAMP-binding protein